MGVIDNLNRGSRYFIFRHYKARPCNPWCRPFINNAAYERSDKSSMSNTVEINTPV